MISLWPFKAHCFICNQKCRQMPLCSQCLNALPHIDHHCYQCGTSLPYMNYCGRCIKKAPSVDYVIPTVSYINEVPKLIYAFKFDAKLILAPAFASLMQRKLHHFYHNSSFPEILIPVPLHKSRIQKRGFNQSLELVKYLSSAFDIPYVTQGCTKHQATQPQSEMTYPARKKNIRGAYKAATLPYKHIALIDDVVTSGATINEIAKTIKKGNDLRIDVWCLARTDFN